MSGNGADATRRRPPVAAVRHGLALVGLALAAFQLYTAEFGPYAPMIQRPVHLGAALILAFGYYRATVRRPRWRWDLVVDAALVVGGVGACWHLVATFEDLFMRGGAPTTADLVFGAVLILVVLEFGRRTVDLVLTVIVAVFLVYAWAGPWLPRAISHRGLSLSYLVEFTYTSTEGIFGLPIGVSATYVYIFLLFSAFLAKTGAGEFFIEFSNALTGRFVGGPAKVAVVSSGLFGTISGSVVANVLGTGSFTIPLMKKLGYEPHFAGAVEAVASTGGQIMPPIMGAVAFVMAELLNISYFTVVVAAIVPALLYYASAFLMVHLRARRLGLRGIPASERPSVVAVFRRGWFHLVPIGVLLYLMMVVRFSAEKSAFWAVVAVVVIEVGRHGPLRGLRRTVAAAEEAATITPPIAAACALAGIIIGVVTATGLGMKVSSLILGLSGGYLFSTLVLIMAVATTLGMGVTTTADYILTAMLGVPALLDLGVTPIAAHMFVLYFACLSAITPPVALGAFAGAGLAGAPFFKTGLTACRLGIAGFLVPFMFVYSPGLLLIGSPLEIGWRVLTALIGLTALAAAVEGWLFVRTPWWERGVLAGAAAALIVPGVLTDILGFAAIAFVGIVQLPRRGAAAAGAPAREAVSP